MNVVSVCLLLFLCAPITVIPPASAITPALLLSPLINANRIQEARNLSLVDPTHFLNVTSHSGFLTVDETYNSSIFFWYFPVANKPLNETPWIIWLQGGPGATSLVGLFDELGPFEYRNEQLKLREWSWGKDHSLLFIDNPIGAGFSFTKSDAGYAHNLATTSGHLYSVLQQFLMIFPELRKAPLYIAGESYAGRYVPAFAMKILYPDIGPDEAKTYPDINLRGLIMGNPVLNRENIADYTAVFHQWGLIDSQGVLAAKPLQDEYINAIQRDDDIDAHNLRDKLLDKLQDIAFQPQLYNVLNDYESFEGFANYIKRPDVREAIHVGDVTFDFSNKITANALITDFLSEIQPKIETLLEHYKILIYCGQLDLTAPCVPNADARRKNWRWTRREEFLKAPRQPWWYNETVAGYVKSGGGFTEVLVRGAGHLVPIDKPAQAQQLISYFIRGLDMPLPPNYSVSPENTPEYIDANTNETAASSSIRAGMIASAVINVVLFLVIVMGVVFFIRWKRRSEAYFYSTAEDSLSDSILTMT